MMRTYSLLLLPLFAAGCATSFTGDAQFPGGASGCKAKCETDGLTMESFVYAGEYSTACVCGPKSRAGGTAPTSAGGAAPTSAGGAAMVAPSAGVVMQMQKARQASR
jgi:hypothetical protein